MKHIAQKVSIVAPWIILILGVVISVFCWYFVREDEYAQSYEIFAVEAQDHIASIEHRMATYEQALRAGVSFYYASDEVTRAEWKEFVENMHVREFFPGIQGFGWAVLINPENLESHVHAIRQELPWYTHKPAGQRDIYSSIIYLEPLDERNMKAIGFDMFSEPTRKIAMSKARDTGLASLSGKVKLVQEGEGKVQAGALLYIPVYKKEYMLNSVEDRKNAIVGFVYAPFRMDDLLNGILGVRSKRVDLHIFDGNSLNEADLMYDSDGIFTHGPTGDFIFHHVKKIEIAGRIWTIDFHSTPEFFKSVDTDKQRIVALSGVIISLLLFSFVKRLINSRSQSIKLAEEMFVGLKTNEVQTSVILATAVNAIITMNVNRVIKTFNPAVEKIFGYKAEEVIGKKVNVLMPSPFREQHDDYVARYLETGEKQIIGSGREVIGQRKDGTLFPIWLSVGQAEINEEILFVGCLVDISARKEAEEKILSLSLAIEQSPNIVIITDIEGNITYVNPRFTDITGYTFKEASGNNPRFLKSGYTTSEQYGEMWQTILAGEIFRLEMLNRRKNGETYWAIVSIAAIRELNGSITGFVSLQEDITMRKRSESDLIAAKEAAESSNRAKSDFLNTMSHELRTPLTVILGYLSLLNGLGMRLSTVKKIFSLLKQADEVCNNRNEGNELNGIIKEMNINFQKLLEQIEKMASEMKKNGEHLLTLINDLLDVSKVEAGKLILTKTHLNVAILVKEVLEILQMKASEKGLVIDLNCQEAYVLADEVRMKQILINLVGNAIKFTDTGKIAITTRQLDSFIEFNVADTGCGIPFNQLERIFDRFHQVDNSSTRKVGGTGLGLAITRQLVELHGGTIRVSSTEGCGSSFIFTIPAMAASI